MKNIQDILRNTYQITFKKEVAYDWSNIATALIEQSQPYEFLKENSFLINEESKENVLYWQDLFFMEIVERRDEIAPFVIEKIKDHELFKSNLKFLNILPKATVSVGRELLIDQLMSVSDKDAVITDDIIEMAVKKKSRDELREKFKEWDGEGSETLEVDRDENKEPVSFLRIQYFKYLVAASVITIIAVIGFNNFNNGYDFDDSQYVQVSNVTVQKNTGLGFSSGESERSISVQIFDYNKAMTSKNPNSDKLVLNTYQFMNENLKLVLENSDAKIKAIELEQSNFYLKIEKQFYKINPSNKFQNLENLKDQKIIEQLNRILFENE
jgi:hypothetical protein